MPLAPIASRHHHLALVARVVEVLPGLRRLVERHHLGVDDEGLEVGREPVVLVIGSDRRAGKSGVFFRFVALEQIDGGIEDVDVDDGVREVREAGRGGEHVGVELTHVLAHEAERRAVRRGRLCRS